MEGKFKLDKFECDDVSFALGSRLSLKGEAI